MLRFIILSVLVIGLSPDMFAQSLYTAPDSGTHTRWFSAENPTGAKGMAGLTNKGAKGNAFYIIQPGDTQVLMNVNGAGMIQRMWMSGTIARNAEQRRAVIINMYWDDSEKPAVSAPIGDFFGLGLSAIKSFDSELFSSPEGRSFNVTIPMPFRTAARVEVVNQSKTQVLFWFDINCLLMDSVPENALYFHAYWSRDVKTTLGQDFQILPKVSGIGRYLGANIGVIGDRGYQGSWFGEGEVKIYLDGDTAHPTLQGTGTEDYIGSGWGQGEYDAQRFGCLVSDKKNDLYAFYRFHTADAVFFHQDIKVTIQQMGSAGGEQMRQMKAAGMEIQPVWSLETYGQDILHASGKPIKNIRLLDMPPSDFKPGEIPARGGNYYRRDDVSATAYFYLNKPSNDLPALAPVSERLKFMREKVWDKLGQ